MKFKEFYNEAIRKMSDEKMDQALKNKSDIITFEFNAEATMEFGKKADVYVTKDQKFFHINKPAKSKTQWLEDIISKYNLKEVK